MSEETFPGQWPFTVPAGTITCVKPGGVLFKASGGDTYAVNGQASSMFKQLPDVEEIWKPDPNNPGLKVSIGDIINYGLSLCGK